MYESKDILFHINHYQQELIESYNLLKLLESGILKGTNQPAQESIEEISVQAIRDKNKSDDQTSLF